jgi:hypothetical protein
VLLLSSMPDQYTVKFRLVADSAGHASRHDLIQSPEDLRLRLGPDDPVHFAAPLYNK